MPTRQPLPMHAPLEDGNFYLLYLLRSSSEVRAVLLADARLAAQPVPTMPAGQPLESAQQYVQPFMLSQADIAAVADALRRQYHAQAALRALVAGPLRSSGTYQLYQDQSDEELLVSAWKLCALGINGILQTYGLGAVPMYPKIDSLHVEGDAAAYAHILRQIAWTVHEDQPRHALSFEPSLQAALLLLEVNHRDEAARGLPLEQGENAVALARVPTVDWSKFRYSVVLIPGIGPETAGVALSPMSRLHAVEAARRFREGQAPFLLLSGGYVHPSQTSFSEAIEMKRVLIKEFGIPASAILIDPQARHTTTNLRNAARQLYRYGLPFDKPALITGDLDQTLYIENPNFQQRCLRELGYSPFLKLTPVSPVDIEWMPNIQSLQQNPLDPLDP